MRESFLLYADSYDSLTLLSAEQKGQLLDAIFTYHRGEDCPELDPVVAMAFSFIRRGFERDAERYEQRCAKNKEVGKLGGRPKKTEREPEKPIGYFENRTVSEKPYHDPDHDIDPDLNIPTTSETAVPEPVGTSPNQDKPTAPPTATPKAEPAQRPDRPAQCPPEDWTKYLRFSRGFHTDKANQLGARAPFTDAKVLDGAKALDTLIRVRGRPEDEVLAVLGWSIEDPFWSTNLRSIKALLRTSSSNGELKYNNVLTAMTRDLEHRAERSMAANG